MAISEFNYCEFFAQLPVFAGGMLAYQLARGQERRPWSRPMGAVVLAAVALGLFSIVDIGRGGFLQERDFFSLGFMTLILAIKACPTRLLVNPITCYLGKVSYSIYLLHFIVLRLAKGSLDTYLDPSQTGLPEFLLLFTLTLAGTAALAWLTYRCVERPCIDLGGRLIRFRRAAASNAAPTPDSPGWPLPEVSASAGVQRN